MCSGWTRLLYSTEIRLFPWVPQFVVNFLSDAALIEVLLFFYSYHSILALSVLLCCCIAQSTAWVKKVAEESRKRMEEAAAVLPQICENNAATIALNKPRGRKALWPFQLLGKK